MRSPIPCHGGSSRRDHRADQPESRTSADFIGGGGRNRTGVHGFAGRCMTTLPLRRECSTDHCRDPADRRSIALPRRAGKKDDSRAKYGDMKWSGRRVSNSRPQPWQGCALPTELLPQEARNYSGPMAGVKRAEPGASDWYRRERIAQRAASGRRNGLLPARSSRLLPYSFATSLHRLCPLCSSFVPRSGRVDSRPVARVVEQVDTRDLKSLGRKAVPVRFRPRAPFPRQ